MKSMKYQVAGIINHYVRKCKYPSNIDMITYTVITFSNGMAQYEEF